MTQMRLYPGMLVQVSNDAPIAQFRGKRGEWTGRGIRFSYSPKGVCVEERFVSPLPHGVDVALLRQVLHPPELPCVLTHGLLHQGSFHPLPGGCAGITLAEAQALLPGTGGPGYGSGWRPYHGQLATPHGPRNVTLLVQGLGIPTVVALSMADKLLPRMRRNILHNVGASWSGPFPYGPYGSAVRWAHGFHVGSDSLTPVVDPP